MINADWNQGRGHTASATIEPKALGAGRMALGPARRSRPARDTSFPSRLRPTFAKLRKRLRARERRAIAAALAWERRRMAADVHDLIMQDLSFALASARTLVDDPTRAPQASTVVTAGERALAGARDVVSGLTERDLQPIVETIETSVRAAARRTPLTFEAEGVPAVARLDQPTRDALQHIAREAVTNAVKYARAHAIEVILECADEWRLTVRDDGHGFDSNRIGEGFGLASMHRQAHALGGTLNVCSATGRGTMVEARLP
jgi:signal transduction histidine kinase